MLRGRGLGNVLDHLTRERIIFLGFLTIFFLVIVLWLVLMIPLSCKLDAALETSASLEQEIEILKSKQAERAKTIPQGSDLPEALGYLGNCFTALDLTIEEIVIEQLSSENTGSFREALIRIVVTGERPAVLQAVSGILNAGRYPFVIQELDISGNRTVIHLKILLQGT